MSGTDVSQLLKAWGAGDDEALGKLIPLVYDELHKRAHNFMKRERAHNFMKRERTGHTLQTGALINETYLRLVDIHGVRIENRSHFLAIASQLMRQVLVDFARQRRAAKRGGGTFQAPLEEAGLADQALNTELLRLDDALTSLAEIDPRKSRIVVLRYFGGLDVSEIAQVMGISTRTVIREWNLARAWLYREVSRK